MADSNFSFLADLEPEIYRLAAVAEDLVNRSPTTALRELRTFGELVVQRLTEAKSLHLRATTQHDRLAELKRRGYIPESINSRLHDIRMQGNDASHENTGTHHHAHEQLRNAWEVARWFSKNVRKVDKVPTSYDPPSPGGEQEGEKTQVTGERIEEVTSELEALRERLRHIENDQSRPADLVEHLKARIDDLEANESENERQSHRRSERFPREAEEPRTSVFRDAAETAGTWLKRVMRSSSSAVVEGLSASTRAVGRTIRALWRFICRLVRWTAVGLTLGAFLIYLPGLYDWVYEHLPPDTQDQLLTRSTVREMHEQVLPPSVKVELETVAATGWNSLQSEGRDLLLEAGQFFDTPNSKDTASPEDS